MIEYFIFALATVVGLVFSGIIVGITFATIYDIWYRKKYGAWIALQEDHNKPKYRPVAK